MIASDALDTALLLLAAGYRVVPVWGKRPVGKNWLREWTPGEIEAVWSRADGVGLILDGYIDFDEDGPSAGEEFDRLGLPETVSWTSHKGRHHVYRLTDDQRDVLSAGGRQKAKWGDLEVRWSPSVQSVIPPSGGRQWLRSLLDSELTPLPDLVWLSDVRDVPLSEGRTRRSGPGYEFNEKADWADVLVPHGYRLVGKRRVEGRVVQDWLRPGETDQSLSLTTGYCQSTLEDDKLYCFSTSCAPLPSNQALSKFAAYAILNCGGDYTAAAGELAGQGYAPAITVDVFDDAEYPVPPAIPAIPAMPGLVEEIAAWHCRRAQVADTQSGRIVGVLAVSWLLGRRAKLGIDTTRANLLAVLSGRPGSGKSEVLQSLKSLMISAGYGKEIVCDVSSGQAMEDALMETARLLYIKDEATDLLRASQDNQHSFSVLAKMREYYSNVKSAMVPRRKASQKEYPLPVREPYFTSLLVGPGSSFWDELPEVFFTDGFVARVLPLSLNDDAPFVSQPSDESPPESFASAVADWDARVRFAEVGDEDGEAPLELWSIQCTPDAEAELTRLKSAWREKRGDEREESFYLRGQELVCKLSMIAAASRGVEAVVDRDIVDSMRDFVICILQHKINSWQTRFVGDRKHKEICDRVKDVVAREDRGEGTYTSWVRNRLPGVENNRLNSVLFGLFCAGEITADKDITGANSFNQRALKLFARKS